MSPSVGRLVSERFARLSGALLAVWVVAVAVATTQAAQTRVVMKDGRIVTGQIYPTKSVVENADARKERDTSPVQSEKIIVVDDQLRRIFVPRNNIGNMVVDDSNAALEVFKFHQQVQTSAHKKIVSLGTYRVASDFDQFGRRVIIAGGVPIVQGITEIAPTYVRVQGLNEPLDMRLSPHSIPRATITSLIRSQIDDKSLDDRLRIYQFYVQASLYEQAAEELQEIVNDFQNDGEGTERLELALRLIRQMAAERLINELELRRAAGQHRKVKELLEAFEENRVSPEKIQAIRRMRRVYEMEDQKRQYLIERITALVEKIEDADLKKTSTSILNEIVKELNSNTLSRFAAFEQAEIDETLNDEQRLAIALSGWLVGNIGSDQRLEVAASLFRVRQLVRKYLLESRKPQRDALWAQIRAEEASTPRQISLLVENMKPPKSPPRSSREAPYLYELSIPSFQNGKVFSYTVQLPPEYDPNRKYPTIVALHGERNSPTQMINWWCGPWVDKTNAQGKQVRERYGQATRFGYIVIAPKWTEPAQSYDFSATSCAAVLYTLRDAARTFSIDTDRVFLSGFMAGGNLAWDVALAHPDLWSGVIPICGEASRFTSLLCRNGEFVPLYGIGGELDGGKLAASRQTLDWGMDLSKPFDMTYVQFKGRGAESFAEETTRVFEWMSTRSRTFYSRDERVVYSIRPWDNFFWSVELFDFSPRTMIDPVFVTGLDASYHPAQTEFFRVLSNSLRIRSHAERAVIFLSPELIDFDRKMEVVFNGKKLTPQNGRVPASSRVILEDARTRCDRQHPFWASLNSNLPGKFNEWDE
ncbi:MAG: alpha/beta hydrolase fold domain-containing protein [Thermoguttaceae bacterium]|nr:alpha/beta hydrolase fold domain-containing protein [Thermoguttaceae bacterium]